MINQSGNEIHEHKETQKTILKKTPTNIIHFQN